MDETKVDAIRPRGNQAHGALDATAEAGPVVWQAAPQKGLVRLRNGLKD